MGLRDYLREQRSRFRTQAAMIDFIFERTGHRVSQPTLSLWLNDERYPDRFSQRLIRDAFQPSERKWRQLMWWDLDAQTEEARDTSAGKRRPTAVA